MKKTKKTLKILAILILLCVIIYISIYFIGSKVKLDINNSNSYYIYDNNDHLVNGLSDQWVTIDNISNNVINATISIEDKNFYKHHGFDFLRLFKSLYINVIKR